MRTDYLSKYSYEYGYFNRIAWTEPKDSKSPVVTVQLGFLALTISACAGLRTACLIYRMVPDVQAQDPLLQHFLELLIEQVQIFYCLIVEIMFDFFHLLQFVAGMIQKT